jgi:WD40 repeat protein/serine/threonine protein kinase
MAYDHSLDEALLQRLPLPLAQLYRRAHNAKTPLERHLTAFSLFEAALKLLGSVAVVAYSRLGQADPELTECLHNLARPSLGHWWEFVRRLVPVLADACDAPFVSLRELLLGRTRDDLPRAAGLDAALRETLEGKSGARATVRLTELFDRLVQYRNKVVAHASPGQLKDDFNERMAGALLLGLAEILSRLDVLAGRRLLYIAEVRQVAGLWLIQRYELLGEHARRIVALEWPREKANQLPDGERVYLDEAFAADQPGALEALHPLLVYEADLEEVLFLNARRGRQRTEYLCYTSGRVADRPNLGSEQRALLARVLGLEVGPEQAEQWAARSQAEEPPAETPSGPARRTLGEFELLSELGQGGMGKVYRAWQPSLGRQVALKVLLHSGDAKAEARFRREIRALGRVDHPHLIKIYTSGAEGEQWFYAMELVEGATLAAVCDELQTRASSVTEVDLPAWQQTLSAVCEEARQAEKPLGGTPPDQPPSLPAPRTETAPVPLGGPDYLSHIVELIRQVAEAAEALHEGGILHRDIKPGNIMVSVNGAQAVLMDLGLAQLADEVEGRLTRTRQFVGTLRYASPQQVLAVGTLDRRSDVYSLGATLWELLTLRPLYGATEQMPTPELMEKIQREEPERPRRHHPRIARDLEAIVLKCLEKDPKRRYSRARELAEDLQRFQNGEPVQARPVGSLERGLRWMKRRKALTALLGVSVLAAITLVVMMFSLALISLERGMRRQLMHALAEAEVQRDDANEQRELVRRVSYGANIRLADLAWRDNRMEDMRRLLEPYRPIMVNDPNQTIIVNDPNQKLRGFEWDNLCRLCDGDLPVLRGHTAKVNCVAYSPDGQRLASASGGDEAEETGDKTVRIWDATTGQELLTLRGHRRGVTSVAFSPDSQRLASASDRTVKAWNAITGQELRTFTGHNGEVYSVAFSPDGQRLASAGVDQTVKLWDATTGQELRTLTGHTDDVYSVAFSPDSRRLASASADKTVRVWDATTGQELRTLTGHTTRVYSVVFSPDGQRLASAGGVWNEPGELKVWDASTGEQIRSLHGHTDLVRSVAYSPDGRRLASASDDKTVKIWDAITGQEIGTLKGHFGIVLSVAYCPDGQRLASAGLDRIVRVWDATTSQELRTLTGLTNMVWSLAFSPDGQRLVSVSLDETEKVRVKVWDAITGHELRTLQGDTDEVGGVVYSPDGQRLASANRDGTVKVWDATTGQELRTLTGHSRSVSCVTYSPDGQRLASTSQDGTVKVWDAATGQEMRTFHGHQHRVFRVVFSPDGQRLAAACDNEIVEVWDATTGQELHMLHGHTSEVYSVVYSPDGQSLASASWDRTVKVWDATTGQELRTLTGHSGPVSCVAYSPDGQRLASASQDGTVKLWDATTGQELRALQGNADRLLVVVFSPDGQRLAAAGGDDDKLSPKNKMFSPDGKRLAAASQDNAVIIWDGKRDRRDIEKRWHFWHQQQAQEAEQAGNHFAAAFHLSWLLKMDPNNADLQERLRRARASLGQKE